MGKKEYKNERKRFKSLRAKGRRIAQSRGKNKDVLETQRPPEEYKRPAVKQNALQEVVRAIERL
ncbi:MAG: hypothetical protein Q7R58_02380 [bacterium]|nr:hypothetical protein [bacterium]